MTASWRSPVDNGTGIISSGGGCHGAGVGAYLYTPLPWKASACHSPSYTSPFALACQPESEKRGVKCVQCALCSRKRLNTHVRALQKLEAHVLRASRSFNWGEYGYGGSGGVVDGP